MSRPTALTPEQLESALRELPDWTLREGALRRSLQFPDFVAAFGFMSSMALVSEALDHHPEWS
ncbi:MAG TPA: 4a-hydroxytetrahydrobiopterin dehydratase, partial [Polyangiales bacterium]|nr:4a-hydroxytetrahydrobiopterin dehydratase [Polyangiales bacterium]